MKNPSPVSIDDLRTNYRGDQKSQLDRHELMGYYVFRPLSFYPTAWFLNMGLTANQTTWISILFLLAGCIFLAVGSYPAMVLGAILVNCWIVLDFVDGNIARYRQNPSRYGEFIDALGASICHLAYFAAGVGFFLSGESREYFGAYSTPDNYPSVILAAGAIASLSAVWIRMVYQKFKNTFPDLAFEKHDVVNVKAERSMLSRLFTLGHNLVNVSGMLLPLLLVAAIWRWLDLLLIFLAAANTMILVVVLARVLRTAMNHELSSDRAE